MKEIYLDNAATTKLDEAALKSMLPYFTEKYGNASSMHLKGNEAKKALEESRRIIAKSINANPNEIIFTSGGTESNNIALKGLFFSNYPEKNHIITTKTEHDSILNACKWLEKQGAKISYLDVDKEGFVDYKKIEKAITKKTFLVSVIHGNNEIGTINDLESIGKVCKSKGVLFHTDACQSYTKTQIDVNKQKLDLVSLNSHKIHGPKGVGALYIKQGIKITPMTHGGGHERKIRSGTENIPGIVGFSKAVDIVNLKDIKKMEILRNKIINEILKISNARINGSMANRLCNNVNVSFNNIEGEAIGGLLEDHGIYTSSGSACMAHSLEPSHVLMAIGLSHVQANSSLRVSISKYTSEEEIDYFLKVLPGIIKRLREISPLAD